MNFINETRVRMSLSLLCGLLACTSQPARALIGNNLSCVQEDLHTGVFTFAPGERYRIVFRGTCTVLRRFPFSARLNSQISFIGGINHTSVRILNPYDSTYLGNLAIGNTSNICLGGVCQALPVNAQVPYNYYVDGIAPQSSGVRIVRVQLGVTSERWQGYGEWFVDSAIQYNVVSPTCSLSTPGNVNLNFGSISNANLNDQIQSTTVSINCTSRQRANVSLRSNKTVVNATTGLTNTSLSGLNIQALWGDTLNPVNFNGARNMQLSVGSNNISLGFKPQLAAGRSPIGEFESQYTLNIEYQ